MNGWKWALFVGLLWGGGQGLCAQEAAWDVWRVQDSLAKQPKPVLLFVHADWCTVCVLQKREIDRAEFGERIYVAEFDAETKKELVFAGKKLKYRRQGKNAGQHELVLHLTEGNRKNVSYPLWVVLDEKLNVLDLYSGFLDAEELSSLAMLFARAETP